VQRRFTKRLPAFGALTFAERLRCLDIPSLLRCPHADLFYCYKVVLGYIDLQASNFFEMAPLSTTIGGAHLQAVGLYIHKNKRSSAVVRQKFFSKRIANIWNNLPDSVDFSSLASFYSAPQCSHCKRCISYGNSVCQSVCPSHAGVVSKRRHVARCSLHCLVAKCV